jgi:hypothetical protein
MVKGKSASPFAAAVGSARKAKKAELSTSSPTLY